MPPCSSVARLVWADVNPGQQLHLMSVTQPSGKCAPQCEQVTPWRSSRQRKNQSANRAATTPQAAEPNSPIIVLIGSQPATRSRAEQHQTI